MKTLTLDIRKHYGRADLYPACRASRLIAAIVQRKCLSYVDLDILEQLGYAITFTQDGHPATDPRFPQEVSQ